MIAFKNDSEMLSIQSVVNKKRHNERFRKSLIETVVASSQHILSAVILYSTPAVPKVWVAKGRKMGRAKLR